MTGDDKGAYDAFYKSTWSYETQGAGYYWLACLSVKRGDYRNALEFIDNALIRGWHNMKARTLKAAILRLLHMDSQELLDESLKIDPLDMGIRYEGALRSGSLDDWKDKMRTPVHNYLELALDYIKAGLYDDALTILASCTADSPMLGYYQGYVYERKGDAAKAAKMYQQGEAACPDYCFPNRAEEVVILESAASLLGKAPYAHYYLGCLLYDKKQYEKAALHWEEAAEGAPDFAMNWRNLAIYYYNKRKDIDRALEYMKKAFELDSAYSRFLLEYDQLRAKAGISVEERLELLSAHLDLVTGRDALYVEYISLLNCTGQYDKALECLNGHLFHPWEGGEGKVSTQYRYALTQKALGLLESGNYDEASGFLRPRSISKQSGRRKTSECPGQHRRLLYRKGLPGKE